MKKVLCLLFVCCVLGGCGTSIPIESEVFEVATQTAALGKERTLSRRFRGNVIFEPLPSPRAVIQRRFSDRLKPQPIPAIRVLAANWHRRLTHQISAKPLQWSPFASLSVFSPAYFPCRHVLICAGSFRGNLNE